MIARFALVAAVLLWAGPCMASATGTNAQVWEEFDIAGDPAPAWHFTALAVAREGENIPDPALWGGGAIVDRNLGLVTLSAGDLYVVARSAVSGARLRVNVPLAAITFTGRIAGFAISDRNRIEELEGVSGNPWRYRNRVAIERPIRNVGPLVAVFANEEVFFDFATDQWTRSRAQAGAALSPTKSTQFRLYYLRQDDRAAAPRAINAIGLTLAVNLR